jgi:hypothetical protein
MDWNRSITPSSARTYFIINGNYPIDVCGAVVGVPTPEKHVPKMVFYGLPTVK